MPQRKKLCNGSSHLLNGRDAGLFNDDLPNIKNSQNLALMKACTPDLKITQTLCKQELSKLSVDNDTSSRSAKIPNKEKGDVQVCLDEVPLLIAFFTFLSYGVLLLVGYFKGLFAKTDVEKNREDYVPLFVGFETFYFRYVFRPLQDVFDRPICSVPGVKVDVLERRSDDDNWTLYMTGRKIPSINIGSYNYLGFAEKEGPCHDAAHKATTDIGVSVSSTRNELGTLEIHKELEALTAEFLGTEAALTFGMGFATNSLNLPALLGPGCLVLSDECNHASLILGLKLSGATVKVFRHNNVADLEKRMRRAIIEGHPRTRRPWKKVLIVVEGIYSMEGTVCNLPRLIDLKKKYKAYLYVDEAHSIGALGPRGRGVVDFYNCDPKDVDILMGTFTKSFAAAGGYIGGSKELIDHLRINSDAQHYASSMAPPVAQQVITSMSTIMGKDGTQDGARRIEQLRRNTHYCRHRLHQLGFTALGHPDSPVIPIPTFLVTKIGVMVREMARRGIAAVGVGFPATKITGSRIRFCLSAGHTKEMLDTVLEEMSELGDLVRCKYQVCNVSQPPPPEDIEC